MKSPTAWDLQIIADMEKTTERLRHVIGDHAAHDMVKDSIGDSRPETALQMKTRLQAKIADLRQFKRQWPEYFCL